MGKPAIKSHMVGKKHLSLSKDISKNRAALNMTDFIIPEKRTQKTSLNSGNSSASSARTVSQNNFTNFTEKHYTLKAEIMWTLFAVKNHYSYKSSEVHVGLCLF